MLSMVVVKYPFSFDFYAGQKEFFRAGNIVYNMLVVLTPLTNNSTFVSFVTFALFHPPLICTCITILPSIHVYKLYGLIHALVSF